VKADANLASFGRSPLGFVKSEVDDAGLVEGQSDLAGEVEAAHRKSLGGLARE
jgi:hypothetical protein